MKPEHAIRTVIVAAVDHTQASAQVVHTAVSMARIIPGAELHFIHNVDVGQPMQLASIPLTDLLREGRSFLDEIVSTAAGGFLGKISSYLAAGDPATMILELATDLSADLVVVGTSDKNALENVFLGSVSRVVTKKARCTVLVARAKDYPAVPEIEPACPACTEVQQASKGNRMWCERHSVRHAHGRLHYETPPTFGVGAMFIRPQV